MKTVPVASQHYGIPERTLREAAARGDFAAEKMGRDWMIYDDDPSFTSWLQRYPEQPRVKGLTHPILELGQYAGYHQIARRWPSVETKEIAAPFMLLLEVAERENQQELARAESKGLIDKMVGGRVAASVVSTYVDRFYDDVLLDAFEGDIFDMLKRSHTLTAAYVWAFRETQGLDADREDARD